MSTSTITANKWCAQLTTHLKGACSHDLFHLDDLLRLTGSYLWSAELATAVLEHLKGILQKMYPALHSDAELLTQYFFNIPSLRKWDWNIAPSELQDAAGQAHAVMRLTARVGQQLVPGIVWGNHRRGIEHCLLHLPVFLHSSLEPKQNYLILNTVTLPSSLEAGFKAVAHSTIVTSQDLESWEQRIRGQFPPDLYRGNPFSWSRISEEESGIRVPVDHFPFEQGSAPLMDALIEWKRSLLAAKQAGAPIPSSEDVQFSFNGCTPTPLIEDFSDIS